MQESWKRKADPVEALVALLNARLIVRGKICDLQRRTDRGFALGQVTVAGAVAFEGDRVRVAFQNENIVAWKNDVPVASTPDLISILDETSGRAITTESLRFGQRVAILAIPCDSKWRTPQGLALAGPRYFGYDLDHVPCEER